MWILELKGLKTFKNFFKKVKTYKPKEITLISVLLNTSFQLSVNIFYKRTMTKIF